MVTYGAYDFDDIASYTWADAYGIKCNRLRAITWSNSDVASFHCQWTKFNALRETEEELWGRETIILSKFARVSHKTISVAITYTIWIVWFVFRSSQTNSIAPSCDPIQLTIYRRHCLQSKTFAYIYYIYIYVSDREENLLNREMAIISFTSPGKSFLLTARFAVLIAHSMEEIS